uniref:LRAT domain-containing protein n=1 Tax=Panagrolaimus davidi TaxID=227884 RepID=A0A914QD08_9BILA
MRVYIYPTSFDNYVTEELKKECMGTEISRVYGKTPCGQHFCFITSKAFWYAVRLIVDEEYRHLKIHREQGIPGISRGNGVIFSDDFLTRERASNFVNEKLRKYSNGEFDTDAFRVRVLPMDVHQNPDRYLQPGDHIQRDMLGVLPISHDGVYLGNGEVADISGTSNNGGSSSSSSSSNSDNAKARNVSFRAFALSKNQEIRIIVHCFRRYSGVDICTRARSFVTVNYGNGQYNFFTKNCQHFATLCVTGKEFLTE